MSCWQNDRRPFRQVLSCVPQIYSMGNMGIKSETKFTKPRLTTEAFPVLFQPQKSLVNFPHLSSKPFKDRIVCECGSVIIDNSLFTVTVSDSINHSIHSPFTAQLSCSIYQPRSGGFCSLEVVNQFRRVRDTEMGAVLEIVLAPHNLV